MNHLKALDIPPVSDYVNGKDKDGEGGWWIEVRRQKETNKGDGDLGRGCLQLSAMYMRMSLWEQYQFVFGQLVKAPLHD